MINGVRLSNWGRGDATENAGVENSGESKIQGWKMQEWIRRHQTARVENAREVNIDSQKSGRPDVPFRRKKITSMSKCGFPRLIFYACFILSRGKRIVEMKSRMFAPHRVVCWVC